MTTIAADDETIEATAFSTSLDPYGQLIRVLMPRASYIAIFDRLSTPLWLSDGCDGFDLLHLVEESLHTASAEPSARDGENLHGFSRSWEGDTAYVFILRDGSNLLGAVAVSCQDGSNGARSTAFVHGLLRPALQVLARELAHQQSVCDLRRNLTSRDGDLAVLLEASGAAGEDDNDDLAQLLENCVANLDCAVGALLIPDRKIALSCASHGTAGGTDAEILEKTQKHLLTWVQVQRRTLVLNKMPSNNPLGALPYRILACPIRHGVQDVVGVLILFRPVGHSDFDARQTRIVEMLGRRIAHVVQSAFDPTTGLLTRSAFEQRVLAQLTAAGSDAEHCVAYADVDRLHVVNESHGMHVGDEVIVTIGQTIRDNLPAEVSASRVSGDRFALFFPGTAIDAASTLLERLRDVVQHVEFSKGGARVPLSISFGLATVPNTRYPLSHALAAAEVACKAAKDRGRGRVEIYRAADRSGPRRQEDEVILGSLREAIVNDRFRMDAQPIIQMREAGEPHRFELLLRMIDSSGERVTPDKFLSAAERY